MSNAYVYICEKCRAGYVVGQESTIFLYIMQPIMNHVDTECPRCKTRRTYWEVDQQFVDGLLRYNTPEDDSINVEVADFASDRSWQHFCAATGRRYPSKQRISGKESRSINNQCAMFAFLLDRGVMS